VSADIFPTQKQKEAKGFHKLAQEIRVLKIGITGASGAIGVPLIKRLIKANNTAHINIYQRMSSISSPRLKLLEERYRENLKFFRGNSFSLDPYFDFVSNSDAIFHLALDSRNNFASHSINEINQYLLLNNTVITAILASIANHQVKPFIFSSSYGIYFHLCQPRLNTKCTEEDLSFLSPDLVAYAKKYAEFIRCLAEDTFIHQLPIKKMVELARDYLAKNDQIIRYSGHPLYAIQKLINEMVIQDDLRAISLRIGNNYGEDDAPDRIVPMLINLVGKGGVQKIYNEKRSFIYQDDIVEILLRSILMCMQDLKKEQKVITVAHPDIISTFDVACKIKSLTSSETILVPEEIIQNRHLDLDLSRMNQYLQMDANNLVSLPEGLNRTIKSLQHNLN